MPYFKNQHNLKLYYELIKPKNKKESELSAIVFLHGFGSSANFFIEQIEILKDNYILLLFDAEGHGKSEKNPRENYREHLIDNSINDLLELLFLLKIDTPFGIIAHSLLGGGIALELAEKFPERVKFLILLNSGLMKIDNQIRNIFWNLLPQSVRMNFDEMIKDNLEEILEKTVPYIRMAILEDRSYSDAFYTKLDGIIEYEIFDMIKNRINPCNIKCPTLIIGAELDNYAPIWMSREISEKIPNFKFEIVAMTGHFGPSYRFDAYNKLILDFLNNLK